MTQSARSGRSGIAGAAAGLIELWALAGGAVLALVMLMNVVSVGLSMAGSSFPGDFELTEIGVAVAAFAFLPYVQLMDGNVSADIFTQAAGPRLLALFRSLACAVALMFAALLLWKMYDGMLSQREYGYETAILQFPIWLGFVPAVVSLGLLVVAAGMTLAEALRDLARGHE